MASLTFVQTRGTAAPFPFNKLTGSIVVARKSDAIEVRYFRGSAWQSLSEDEAVDAPLPYEGLMSVMSTETGSHVARIEHLDDSGRLVDELDVELHVLHVRVDVDADRDGTIGDNEEGKLNWVWGEGQRGAIVLVNNDRDTQEMSLGQAEQSELAEVLIRPTGSPLPRGCELVLVVTPDEAARISIYRAADEGGPLEMILGRDALNRDAPARSVSPSLGEGGARCFL